jgi:phage terminase large subunit GpA
MKKSDDLKKLKPGQLVTMLNSYPELGSVVTTRTLYRWRQQAGKQISSDGGKTIDFYKFASWIFDKTHQPATPVPATDSYDKMKESARKRNLAKSKSARDIAPLPAVVNPKRKKACGKNFKLFCKTYFSDTFNLEWSEDHLVVIRKIETVVLKGGLFAVAMPRGQGKSCLAEIAVLWSVLYGHRQFPVLIGATKDAADESLDTIKTEIETNDLLMEDFPEVCYPIRRIEESINRSQGQLYNGKRTRITWGERIVLPTIPDALSSGAVIRILSLTGRIRGMKYRRPDGKSVRPNLIIIDDPQTRESAHSIEQTRKRLKIVNGDILGLAGPGKKIAGIMPCTIIEPGDMVDQLLNPEKHPEWNGIKTCMVIKFPTNKKLWEKYAETWAESLRMHGDIRDATEFYRQNRKAMDKGAKVSWEERYNDDEISALQNAMNLKILDEPSFYAEYQNNPILEAEGDNEQLTVALVTKKLNNFKRGTISVNSDYVTMFIDVQGKLLYYIVTAWTDDFAGHIIDYGTYPDQRRREFTLDNARMTLKRKHPGTGLEGSIYAGLEALTSDYLSREFRRDDGAMMSIDRCLIDANWGQSTDVVYQFCRESVYTARLMPSHGRYVGASSRPMTERKKQKGERLGHHYFIPSVKGKRVIRYVVYDTNYWKTFIRSRFLVSKGDPGSLTLFGSKPDQHQIFAEHCSAEYSVQVSRGERKVDEWKHKISKPDNHWFDCLVGSAMAASMEGAKLPGASGIETSRRAPRKPRQRNPRPQLQSGSERRSPRPQWEPGSERRTSSNTQTPGIKPRSPARTSHTPAKTGRMKLSDLRK